MKKKRNVLIPAKDTKMKSNCLNVKASVNN